MAPLTFPNEKQMVSKEEWALQKGWARREVVFGGLRRAASGALGGILPHTRDRGEKRKPTQNLFRGWVLIFFLLFFDAGWVRRREHFRLCNGEVRHPHPPGWGTEGALGTGWGRPRARLPPGQTDKPTNPGPGPAQGQTRALLPKGGSPISRCPPPLLFGAISLQRCAFRLGISCRSAAGKQKDFAEKKPTGGDLMPPLHFYFFFPKRNHLNLRQNSAEIFAVLRISFFNECGKRRHRDYFFFYEGENTIFRDFVGGVKRPHLPVSGRGERADCSPGCGGSSAGNRPLEEFNLPL